MGLLEKTEGLCGSGCALTRVTAALERQPSISVVTVYKPSCSVLVITLLITIPVAVKPSGPLQRYEAPGVALAERVTALPKQTGLLEVITGVGGCGGTIKLKSLGAEAHPFTIALTE